MSFNPAPVYSALSEADLDAVTALEASLQDFPWSRGHFADSQKDGHPALVCRVGAETVGFAVSMVVLDEAHLLNIGIDRRFQGQGYGAALLQRVLDDAWALGVRRLLLEVRPSNRQAIVFYLRFGFTQIGLRRGYYPAASGREDALIFDKELP